MGTLVLMVHSISNMQAGSFLVKFQPEKLSRASLDTVAMDTRSCHL